jgi:hypothetical protein
MTGPRSYLLTLSHSDFPAPYSLLTSALFLGIFFFVYFVSLWFDNILPTSDFWFPAPYSLLLTRSPASYCHWISVLCSSDF